MKKAVRYVVASIALLILVGACGRKWLDEKRDLALTVPTTLKDMRALLNNEVFQMDYIALSLASSDDYYYPADRYEATLEKERNLYTWAERTYPDQSPVAEWNENYHQVFLSNVVLDGLAAFKPKAHEHDLYNQLKGEALFYRGKAFFNLANLFSEPYSKRNATELLGIPLRLTADINSPITRDNLENTFSQIVKDLLAASSKLPAHNSIPTQPRKAAAHALLARSFLMMENYSAALLHADSAWVLSGSLMDFNELTGGTGNPFLPYNQEVIFSSIMSPRYLPVYPSYAFVDTALYSSYHDDDLRKALFFNQNNAFVGNYSGSNQTFSGTTSGEMLLIKSECHVRLGNYTEAMEILSLLLSKRHKKPFHLPEIPHNELLNYVLAERRKELVYRGRRWFDLRRLNLDPKTQTVLYRIVDGDFHELLPNSPRYTFPIPDVVVESSGMVQNRR